MPREHRDPHSKARLFIPTAAEKAHVQRQRELKQSLEEVNSLKAELKDLVESIKNKK